LSDRYHLQPPENCTEKELEDFLRKKKIIQVRVINAIKKWVGKEITLFQQNKNIFLILQKFIQWLLNSGGNEAVWGSNLQLVLEQTEIEQENPSLIQAENAAPKPILPKTLISRLLQFTDIHPQELARQLTLIENKALAKVTPHEYIRQAWCGPNKETFSPNLLSIIVRFNKISYWIVFEIVKQNDLQARVKRLSKFIKLGMQLRALNNLQSLMAVYSALNMSPVQRLSDTWKAVPAKKREGFKEIAELMAATHNFKTYREMVRQTTPPMIPFQGVYLSDLTFLEEAPDILENGMVNFRKMSLIGEVLNEIERFQKFRYKLNEVACIQEYILSQVTNLVLEEKLLYNMSKTVEPKKE